MATMAWCSVPELKLLKKTGGKASTTTVLMGAYLTVLEEDADPDGWYKVKAFGKEGYVRKGDTSQDNSFFKLFFIDVGQGDSCLIETPTKRFLIDGGQYARNAKSFLTKWKYRWLIAKGHKVHIDGIVISHFDADHFAGLTSIISDPNFTVGTVYHNGIGRFDRTKAKRDPSYDTHIGKTNKSDSTSRSLLLTSFNDIESAKKLLDNGGLMFSFRKFLDAVVKANDQGRLGKLQRLTTRAPAADQFDGVDGLKVTVLGPVPATATGPYKFHWFEDEGHTINGNSIVLRFDFDERSFLLGGDLNIPSEEFLLAKWDHKLFRVDVAKACHHGASEFTVEFMKAVKPFATVFSSGDNENYAHPRADALGCAGKYARGIRPLIFSTELARSYKSSVDIHYGLINCRTDGKKIVLAKMYEKSKSGDMWDSYTR